MSTTLVIISLLSQPLGPEKPISREPPTCVISGEIELSSDELRNFPEISCDYGVTEFKRRLLSVFQWPSRGLNIETLERTFSLPKLKTTFDAPREANFTAYASGLGGDAGWSASLNYRESFTPMDAWRRPRFRGLERPVLINPRIRGERLASIEILPGRNSSSPPPVCFKAGEFRDAAQRAGWRESEILFQVPTLHGSVPPPSVVYKRGRWSVTIEFDRQNQCAEELHYGTNADLNAN